MQITVANSKNRVVVMDFAKRLFTQMFKGAMLIGIASITLGLIASADSARETLASGDVESSGLNCTNSLPGWVPFAYAPACFATSAKTNNAKKKVKVWKLVQRNAHGNSVLLFNESAIKYTFVDQHVSWSAAAPSWNVCIYNKNANRGMLRPLAYSIGRQDNKFDYGHAKLVSKTNQLFENRPAIKMLFKVSAADPLKEKVEMMYQTGSQRADSFSTVEEVFIDFMQISPQVQHVLNGMIRLSNIKGVMVAETHIYPSGRKNKVLTTQSCVQCEVPASEFDYPTGFTKSTLKDIMEEKEKAREMSGVFEELLFDPLPTKGTKGAKGK